MAGEVGRARAAGAHPGVGDGRRAAERVGMAAAQPDRRVRLLHRLESHGAAFEVEDAALVADLRLGPQRLDELDPLPEAPHAVLPGHLELRVVVVPAQSDAEDRPAVAHVVEGGHLVRHVDGIVNGQDEPPTPRPGWLA